jgi:hypothetical protein
VSVRQARRVGEAKPSPLYGTPAEAFWNWLAVGLVSAVLAYVVAHAHILDRETLDRYDGPNFVRSVPRPVGAEFRPVSAYWRGMIPGTSLRSVGAARVLSAHSRGPRG